MDFKTPYELRKIEGEIRKCEIRRGEKIKTIYVDIDINTVFKNIIMIEKRNEGYYKFKVRWFDPLH